MFSSLRFKISSDDDQEGFEVTAGPRDILAWEKSHRDNSLRSLWQNMKLVDLYVIAHQAARRTGMATADLLTFQQQYDVALIPDAEDLETEETPTRPEV